MSDVLDLALRHLPKPTHLHVEHDLRSGVRLHITLATPAEVRAWAAAMGGVLAAPASTGPIHRDLEHGTEFRFTTVVLERPGLAIRVGACEMALSTDPPLPELVESGECRDEQMRTVA